MRNLEAERARIANLFNIETLQGWARDIEFCDGNHAGLELIEKVRKITFNERFIRLRNSGTDYLIPNASWQNIPGIEEEISRGFLQEVILAAELMAYSTLVDHGLSESELEIIYKHHSIELMIFEGKRYGVTPEQGIASLAYYIGRCTLKVQ